MHVVGCNPGEKRGGQQYDDRGQTQPPRKELRPNGEDEHKPKAEENRVRGHRKGLFPSPPIRVLIRAG